MSQELIRIGTKNASSDENRNKNSPKRETSDLIWNIERQLSVSKMKIRSTLEETSINNWNLNLVCSRIIAYDKEVFKIGTNKRPKLEHDRGDMAKKNSKKLPQEISKNYIKSNRIINAKGKSTALGLKIFAVGVIEAKQNEDGSITAVVAGQQLRELFDNYNGSFYTQIKDLIKPTDESKPSILDWRIYVENEETEKIEGINVINDAKFEDGELSLTFNNKIKNDIYGLKDNYGMMSLATTIQLQSPYSIRMYEMFKAFMDRERAITGNNGPYYVTYSYDDFKQTLGLINPAQDLAAAKKSKKKELFPSYTSFRKNVLDKARQELNEISSVHMDYMPIRSGRGGRVTGLEFILSRQNQNGSEGVQDHPAAVVDTSSNEMTDAKFLIITEVSQLLQNSGLSLVDIKAVCDAACYDQEKIRAAYMLSQHAGNIENLTGWLISAIRNDYQPRETEDSKMTKSVKKESASGRTRKRAAKNSFQDFEQNEYDFEALEQQIIEHGNNQ